MMKEMKEFFGGNLSKLQKCYCEMPKHFTNNASAFGPKPKNYFLFLGPGSTQPGIALISNPIWVLS